MEPILLSWDGPEVQVDVYAVGALADLLFLLCARRHRKTAARKAWRSIRRHWRDRNHWNGYLVEPHSTELRWHVCGHGWTKRRAHHNLANHLRHHNPEVVQ